MGCNAAPAAVCGDGSMLSTWLLRLLICSAASRRLTAAALAPAIDPYVLAHFPSVLANFTHLQSTPPSHCIASPPSYYI